MTNYTRGATFERTVRADLETNGYLVQRSAGSKGVADLAAFKPGDILFVQAKRDGRIGPDERANLLRTASWVGALPIVAYKRVGSSQVLYWRLTGTGPKDKVPFVLDEVEAAA